MKYLKCLIESRPFLERQPAQDILNINHKGENHLQATRWESYALIYSPMAKE